MIRAINIPRAVAAAALIGAAVLVVVLLTAGGSYTVHAHFRNASGLVKGGLVQVAGRRVGKVKSIGVTPDGEADVTLSIDDDVAPLRRDGRLSVRALGQAGIANHFVDVAPGSAGSPEVPDGGTVPDTQTDSMVSLDALLSSFGPAQRRNLRELIAHTSDLYAGSGAATFNRMLAKLDPALAEVAGLTGELARDRASIQRVVQAGARAASAIDARRTDLRDAVTSSATAFRAVADQEQPLADLLDRTPEALAQAQTTLRHTSTTLDALRPTLREAPRAAAPLSSFLGRATEVLPRTTPVLTRLRTQLPAIRRSLAGFKGLEAPAIAGLRSATTALHDVRPILKATRFYGSDFVLGILGGLTGAGGTSYSRWGHYTRLDFIQPPQASISGLGSGLLTGKPLVPGLIDLKTQLTRRCPGGNVPPAIDGSSPWVPDPSLCDPAQSIPEAVNEP